MHEKQLFVVSLFSALAGLILLFYGFRGDPPKGRRRCPKCWYDLRGTVEHRCPECGKTFKTERQVQRTRRYHKPMAVGAILVASGCGWSASWLLKPNWPSALPDTLLILSMPLIDNPNHPVAVEIDARYLQKGNARYYIPNKLTVDLWDWQRRLLAKECNYELFRRSRNEIKSFALCVLAHLEGDAKHAVLGLAEELESENVSLVCSILESLGPDALPAMPAIIAHLEFSTNTDYVYLFSASPYEVIMSIGSPARAALPALVKKLDSDRLRERCLAIWAMGAIGPDPRQPVDWFSRVVKEDDPYNRAQALWALCKIAPGSPASADAIHLALRDPEVQLREKAVDIIRQNAEELSSARDRLMTDLKSESAATRVSAARALMSLGPDAEPAADALFAALKDSEPLVRASAIRALLQMKTVDYSANAAQDALKDDADPMVRDIVDHARSSAPVSHEE